MKYLLLLLLVTNVQADEIEIIVRRKLDNKIVAGDRGRDIGLNHLRKKARVNIDDPAYSIETINHSEIENSRKNNIDNFDMNSIKKNKYLKEIIQEYLRKSKINPGV